MSNHLNFSNLGNQTGHVVGIDWNLDQTKEIFLHLARSNKSAGWYNNILKDIYILINLRLEIFLVSRPKK